MNEETWGGVLLNAGLLSERELEELRRALWRSVALTTPAPYPWQYQEEDWYDLAFGDEDAFLSVISVPTTRVRSTKPRPSARRVTTEDILAALEAPSRQWAPTLAPLETLAARLPASHRAPLDVLRATPVEALTEALSEALSSRSVSFAGLWEALTIDAYRAPVAAPGALGPAVTAYQAVIGGADVASLGKHSWILRAPAIATVASLVQAQRRVLEAYGALVVRAPEALVVPLAHSMHPVGWWASVVMYCSAALGYDAQGEHPRRAVDAALRPDEVETDEVNRKTLAAAVGAALAAQRRPVVGLMMAWARLGFALPKPETLFRPRAWRTCYAD